MLDNPVALIVALIGTAGVGGLFREIMSMLTRLGSGLSAKESNRKRDLVTERDFEYDRAEAEARNRRRTEEYSAKLRRLLIENGLEKLVPKWPRLENIPDRVPGAPVTVESNPPEEDYNRRSSDQNYETDSLQTILDDEITKPRKGDNT